MMSLSDFNSKKIIMVFPQNGDKLSFQNTNLILKNDDNKIKLQYTCYKIFAIFVIGGISITSVLIEQAKKYSFSIVLLTSSFKEYEIIANGLVGNTFLRKRQYIFDNCLGVSKFIIKNKIQNQLEIIQHIRCKNEYQKNTIKLLKTYLNNILIIKNNYELMGIEGSASKIYFKSVFNNINWNGRQPRVKRDITNLLLDIGYTMLFNIVKAMLLLYGFDTYYGNLHQEFYKRESLVCDIIEPFRPIIDYKIRRMFNLNQINKNDFGVKNDKYYLKPEANSIYIEELLKEILVYKECMFNFIKNYYRWFMKGDDITLFPVVYLIKNDINKL